ncbi:MAG: hypothetical protein H7267_07820 [Sandarakinorhabdus sp.]|nr:hypothetical protein [Sandarakinorhabdus sp.]
MSARHASLIAFALLAGCAPPSQRITTRLTELGMAPKQAKCMGDGFAQRLNAGQLQRLSEIARLNRGRIGRMTLSDIAGALNKNGDEALVAEVLRIGLRCAF